ncbi:MAG TPA: VWA domain-containing protein [Streptosporangiaceae bacterium]|nr:VWA domain-containing protein [Streptosporangiaceae bacterium]
MAAQFDVSEFTAPKAKPLPVVLLLDTSGSMYGDKISSLNDAVRKMLGTFRKKESQASEFLVSIITFGGTASLAYSPTPASELAYTNLSADAGTPLGAAIDVAKALIEDREKTPSRAYRPLVVLVSDGVPTDSWESRLDHFIQDGRSAKCDRMALGIGREAYTGPGRATLERFIAGTEHHVFEAKDAGEIHNFFKFVTMSVVSRSLSQNPNEVPKDSTLQPPQPEAAPAASAQAAATATDEEDSYW